jgi:hypothetical protein
MAGQPQRWPADQARSRRQFLVAAGTSALGAGVAWSGQPASAEPADSSQSALLDVRAYGATGDGLADDTPAIQRAIDAAQARGGGIAALPPGRYLVRPPGLRITGPIQLRGSGWRPANPFPPAPAPGGSWLLCDTPGTPVIRLEVDPGSGGTPAGASVRQVAVAHHQPAGASVFRPGDYPPAITVGDGCTDVVLEDLLLLNPTRGVQIGSTGPVGRVVVRRLCGEPLTDGIVVDGCYDILRLEDIHFWPYWRYGDGHDGVAHWVANQATGITLYRCDNPMLQGVFCFGYAVGLALRQSGSGSTHKCKVSDSDFDLCGTGIHISGVAASGFDPHTVVNVSIQGPDSPTAENLGGIVVDETSSQVRLAVSNATIYNFGGSGIHVAGRGTTLLADNLFIQQVNLADNGAAGIRAVAGARARVGWGREISVAHNGPETEGHVELAIGVPSPEAHGDLVDAPLPSPPERVPPTGDNPLLPPANRPVDLP